jgi:hypothetical protein
MDMVIDVIRDSVRVALLIFSQGAGAIRIYVFKLISHCIALDAKVSAASGAMVPGLNAPAGKILSEVQVPAPNYRISGRRVWPPG